jgi:ABC-2 type transport system permease protein
MWHSLGFRLSAFGALFIKELRQIRRNRQLLAALVVPPTLQVLLFGFGQNPDVTNVRLGVVDEAHTQASRELIRKMSNSQTFRIDIVVESSESLARALQSGSVQAGLIIPHRFELGSRAQAPQLLLDGSNPNTAMFAREAARAVLFQDGHDHRMKVMTALHYNPGLESSWFIVTGTIAILLFFNASIVTASALMTEKEHGTLDQLLMTPLGSLEIIAGKVGPIVLLLAFNTILALGIAVIVFHVPMRGSVALVVGSGTLCIAAGSALGMLISTFSTSQSQAQLVAFFVNAPLALVSGATTPVEAMPDILQILSFGNPVRHYAVIARDVMLKGAEFQLVKFEILAMVIFAGVMFAAGVSRFRRQLR